MNNVNIEHVSYTIFWSLPFQDIELVNPFTVQVWHNRAGEYLLSYNDFGVHAGGDEWKDAYDSFLATLRHTFLLLNSLSDDQLGPKMRAEKATMNRYLRRKEVEGGLAD